MTSKEFDLQRDDRFANPDCSEDAAENIRALIDFCVQAE